MNTKQAEHNIIVKGDVTILVTTCGKGKYKGEVQHVMLDTADIDIVLASTRPWHVYRYGHKGELYCATTVGANPPKMLLLHREIMKPPKKMVVHHINTDGLDCRRSTNLKIVTHGDNLRLCKLSDKAHGKNKSLKVRNVYKAEHGNRFEVIVHKKYRGSYDTLKEAKQVAKEYRAQLNYERWGKHIPGAVEPTITKPYNGRVPLTDEEKKEHQRTYHRKYFKTRKGKAARQRATDKYKEKRRQKLQAA